MTLHCAGCGGELEGKAHFSDGDDRGLWLWCPDCDQSGDFAAGDVRHLDDGNGIATDGGAHVGDAEILHYECQNDDCGREFDLPEYDYCPYCGSVEFEPVRAATDGGGAEVTDGNAQKFEIEIPSEEGNLARGVMIEHREHGAMHVERISVGHNYKEAQLQAEMSNVGLSLTGDEVREQWNETIDFDPTKLYDRNEVRLSCNGVTTDEVDVELDITTEGKPQGQAEPIHMFAKDAAVRALQAFEEGKPPQECEGFVEFDWEQILADHGPTDGERLGDYQDGDRDE